MRLTASRAASSGRQSTTTSASLRYRRRASGSLRDAAGISRSVTSSRGASRSWIRSPVVPACPSMNTLVIASMSVRPAASRAKSRDSARRTLQTPFGHHARRHRASNNRLALPHPRGRSRAPASTEYIVFRPGAHHQARPAVARFEPGEIRPDVRALPLRNRPAREITDPASRATIARPGARAHLRIGFRPGTLVQAPRAPGGSCRRPAAGQCSAGPGISGIESRRGTSFAIRPARILGSDARNELQGNLEGCMARKTLGDAGRRKTGSGLHSAFGMNFGSCRTHEAEPPGGPCLVHDQEAGPPLPSMPRQGRTMGNVRERSASGPFCPGRTRRPAGGPSGPDILRESIRKTVRLSSVCALAAGGLLHALPAQAVEFGSGELQGASTPPSPTV